MNNLIVLARENDGANEIISNKGLNNLSHLLDSNDIEVKLAVMRILSSMTKNSFKRVNIPRLQFRNGFIKKK